MTLDELLTALNELPKTSRDATVTVDLGEGQCGVTEVRYDRGEVLISTEIGDDWANEDEDDEL